MATINAARYYRVDHALGSLTPGRQADILLVDDLEAFGVRSVVAKGALVVDDGEVVADLRRPLYPAFLKDTVRLAREARASDFAIAAPERATDALVRVIGAEILVSDERHIRVPAVDGAIPADVEQDVVKLAMLDRYGAAGPPAMAFLQGYELKRGALGTTYNPMYHNVLVAGVDDADMATAANALVAMGGGFVAVEGDEVVAVPLPLCGLMSDAAADEFLDGMRRIYAKARELGCTMGSPFHNLAFTTVCGELPFFKLSHEGPFDVAEREVRSLLVEQSAMVGEEA
jgi:adenine deaminase